MIFFINTLKRFLLLKIIILQLFICSTLTQDLSADLIKLKDTEDLQTFQCNTSLSGACQIQYIPASSFYGILEVTYKTLDEDDYFTYQNTIQSLFCIKNKQFCDFNGQYMSLRNLSLEVQFNQHEEYYFTLQALSNNVEFLILTFKINKGSSCLNNNCHKHGQCININNKQQCSCNDQYGGKNCEAFVESYHPNTQNKLRIPSKSHKVIQYAFKNTAQEVFENTQLDFIFSQDYSQKSDLQKLSVYILDGQSSRNNGIYKYDLEQTIDSSININQLFFSSSNATSNMILLIMIFNENNFIQNINIELKISDIIKPDSDSSSDAYFIYILIGIIGFTLLIIISGIVYLFIKKHQLKKNTINNQNMLAQTLIQHKIALKQTGNQDKYQKILNEAIPPLTMTSIKIKEITQQISGTSNLVQNNMQDLNSSEIQNDSKCICSICLQHIQEGDRYRQTICKHLFHVECIDIWIQKQLNCPMCRNSHNTVDLLRHIKVQKNIQITETHKIKGKILEFEMHDNSYKIVNSQESSPLGFIPISLTPQQSSSECAQELASPQKVTQYPSPFKTSELQLTTQNDSSQILIADHSNDLIKLILPHSHLNESCIPELIFNNENNIFNNSFNSKIKNQDQQNSALTKIVNNMSKSSSIINYVSHNKNKCEKFTNFNKLLKPILEEDNNSHHNSQTRKSSHEIIFINDQFGSSQILDVDFYQNPNNAMNGSLNIKRQQESIINSETCNKHRQNHSGIKLTYNFELQPQAQALFLKSQLLISPNLNDNGNFLFKPRLTK